MAVGEDFLEKLLQKFSPFSNIQTPRDKRLQKIFWPKCQKGLDIQWEMEILIKTKSQERQNSLKKNQKAKQ